MRFPRAVWALAVSGAVLVAGCGSPSRTASASGATGGSRGSTISIVAGENEYGDVAAQIGGAYVKVYSVDSNPNTDPHAYEATPSVGRKIAGANLLIDNGVGYDDFMSKLASASPSAARKVVDVQHLLGLPDSTSNPHLWYDPKTMPAVARALVTDLSALDPAHSATFRANGTRFVASLRPWLEAIGSFEAGYGGTTAATTEPVADYLLTAMGIDDLTPWRLQVDVMNGTDPSPQDVSSEHALLTRHKVKVFCYNPQVTDPLTDSARQAARRAGVPVVAVYETMPVPGYDYQSWMTAEVDAIRRAVADGVSTERL